MYEPFTTSNYERYILISWQNLEAISIMCFSLSKNDRDPQGKCTSNNINSRKL